MVEPFDVPLRKLPQFHLHRLPTPLCLGKDMDHKILKGHNHIRWVKRPNRHRRFGNCLIIVILPENPLRQVKAHPILADHDSNGATTDVVERRDVWLILGRHSYDINIHHQINEAYVISRIRIAPGGFSSSRKRVIMLITFDKLPRNELPEVLQNSSLQTQRDTIILAPISYKQIQTYIQTQSYCKSFMICYRKEKKILP